MKDFYTKFAVNTSTGKTRIVILEDGYRVKGHPTFKDEAKADTYIAKVEKNDITEEQRDRMYESARYKKANGLWNRVTATEYAVFCGDL